MTINEPRKFPAQLVKLKNGGKKRLVAVAAVTTSALDRAFPFRTLCRFY